MAEAYGRYREVRNASWQIILDNKISSLPVSVMQISRENDILVVSFERGREILESIGLTDHCIENEGFAVFLGKWIIFYDDRISSPGRIRFTLAHELSHILLGHEITIKYVSGFRYRFSASGSPRSPLERDADMLATRLLAPACALWGIGVSEPDEISALCGISMAASRIRSARIKELLKRQKFLTDPLEKKVFKQFLPFIEEHKKSTAPDLSQIVLSL